MSLSFTSTARRKATLVLFLVWIAAASALALLLSTGLGGTAEGAEEGPMIVDFGGAPPDAPVAGMDQWLAGNDDGHFVPSAVVSGPQKAIVLRVYFKDYAKNSRYDTGDVTGFFNDLDTLWQNTSYGKMSISHQVTELFQLPDNRSKYVDDFADGDLSNGDKYGKVLTDAVANSPAGLDWTNIQAVMVVMAETNAAQFHRGQANKCNLKMGPAGAVKKVGCAIFSENPTETDLQVWGRWAHEIGHAFQQGGPGHPSNYSNEFELMDSNYPGQTGVFEKQAHTGFPGWMPGTKYVEITPETGGENICLWAMEYDPADKPNPQAIKAEITGNLYYMVSVRRRVRGDELNGDFQGGPAGSKGIPDEGVLIERVSEGSDPWVKVIGNPGRNTLWDAGDVFNTADGITISVRQKVDEDNYSVDVSYDSRANQPDVMLMPWTSPPGDTWETTDIWVDNPINGYGTYRYGMWSDLSGNLVPRGNGDDPAIGQINRLYARVRNIGTQAATDVKVDWEITDPPGVGIAGANGWAGLGSVDKTDFAGLASIAPGAFLDVYVDWTPNFPISPEDLAAGRFYFHTCVRVKLNHVAGETVFGNQDGDREQENIDYFQAVVLSAAVPDYDELITLRNDDLVNPKYFHLSYDDDIPAGWDLQVNGGVMGIEIPPGEVRQIPIHIQPVGPAVLGSIFGVDVSASSLNLLVNDLDPKDKHPEFDSLGGVRVEARVMERPTLTCTAEFQGQNEYMVTGKLSSDRFEELYDSTMRVAVQGVNATRAFIPGTLNAVRVETDGTFQGLLNADTSGIGDVQEGVCLFAGTTHLASASSGFVFIPGVTPVPPPKCNGKDATRVGTHGADFIMGTPGDDVIVAMGGDDIVLGLGGNDVICLGTRDDVANAGPGRDWLSGDEGDDIIRGAAGRDRLLGGDGDDILRGGRHADRLFGGRGHDILRGGLGEDRLEGNRGDDILAGGDRKDKLFGGKGADMLAGQGGDDHLDCGPNTDVADGGTGGGDTEVACETVSNVP